MKEIFSGQQLNGFLAEADSGNGNIRDGRHSHAPNTAHSATI